MTTDSAEVTLAEGKDLQEKAEPPSRVPTGKIWYRPILSAMGWGKSGRSYNPLVSVYFTYFDPLMLKGYFKATPEEDLPDLLGKDKSQKITEKFLKKWEHQQKKKRPSLVQALISMVWKELFVSGLWSLILLPIPFIGPFILYQLIRYVDDDGVKDWEAWLYVLLAFIGPLVGSVAMTQMHVWGIRAGQIIKSVYSNVVFTKAMKIYTGSLQEVSSGNIVNLSSQDPLIYIELMPILHQMWVAPIQIAIATVSLWLVLGFSSLVGLAIMVLMMPVYAFVGMCLFGLKAGQVKLADERVKLINECIIGMRVIKMFGWEQSFVEKIEKIRRKEMLCIGGFQLTGSLFTFFIMISPLFVTMGALTSYILAGNTLTPKTAFVTTSLFNVLRMPILQFPMIATQCLMALVSMLRLQKYLSVREIPVDVVEDKCSKNENAVEIENATFDWKLESSEKKKGPSCLSKLMKKDDVSETKSDASDAPPALQNITLEAKAGALVAIIGHVGSGKSSLISALVGDIPKLSGSVRMEGASAYVPQSAWVVNGTLRDNILFGKEYDEKKYRKVIQSCALESDLAILAGGDMAELGERGINLSGGQKQRISMARAMYADCQVYLFDDPLSAVDNRVGIHMFEHAIRDGLAGKTRILVTNQLQYLSSVDYIYVLKEGSIAHHGTYSDLQKRGVNVGDLVQVEDSKAKGDEIKSKPKERERQMSSTKEKSHGKDKEDETAASTLVHDEDRSIGAVSIKVYITYLSAAGGLCIGILILATAVAARVIEDSQNVFLALWTDDKLGLGQKEYLAIYVGWGFGALLIGLFKGLSFVAGGFFASRRLHSKALRRMFRFPVSFFDATPVGRVLNRFAADTAAVDTQLPMLWEIYVSLLLLVLFIFILITISIFWLAIPLVAILVGYLFLQRFFTRTAIEFQRLEAVNRSPVFSYLSEVLRGTSTVRAYGQQQRFLQTQYAKVDRSNNSLMITKYSMMWLQLRLENLGAFLSLTISGVVVLTKGQIDSGYVGLALTYSTGVILLMGFVVMLKSQVEMIMNNVERISDYGKLPVEGDLTIPKTRPSPSWPEKGAIEFQGYSLRYRPELPKVIDEMNVKIEGGLRVGIIGRTGAGKSSIANALFRMVEPDEGSIVIDGVDVTTIGMHDLRRHINIIPQDPTLFSGTVRSNIDPFSNYTDDEIWSALEHVKMRKVVEDLPSQLKAEVTENGENFSQGQQQLFCLARALICQPRVLVMDEATASVDSETDAIIQEAVRSQFKNTTLLTVAHRLNTVLDYDKLLVMEKGKVVEFDSPANLLKDKDGFLSKLVDAAGDKYSQYLRSLVGVDAPVVAKKKRGPFASFWKRDKAPESVTSSIPSMEEIEIK